MSDQEAATAPQKETKPGGDLGDQKPSLGPINPVPSDGGDGNPPPGEHGEYERPRQ